MNGGYFTTWSGSSPEQQQQQQQVGCPHFSAAATAASSSATCGITAAAISTTTSSTTPGAPAPCKASWTAPVCLPVPLPDLYDHSSLLECSRCITQGHLRRYGGAHGQGSTINILDGELMQDLHYNIEDEDEMCLGMEMKIMKKRKLTTEQARQLEASFEADKKLEAEKKQRLAEQLGLQPRQVAVWFQNRRARSKTKQLELDFLTLKAEYDRVLAQRRTLQAEVARLSAQLQAKSLEAKNHSCSQDSTSSTNSNNGDVVSESTTFQTKMESPTKDGEGLTSNFGQDFGKGKEGVSKLQELSKSPNLNNYEWEPYDNGLWVFD